MSQPIIELLNLSKPLTLCLILGCLFALSAGCASVESTMVTRDETNQYWERHNCLNGIPITIRVPTHLKLYVFHKHYIQPVNLDANNRAETYSELDVGVVVRDFAQEFMYTEKVFFVDFKRPAAGSSNLRVKMTDQQYIAGYTEGFDELRERIKEFPPEKMEAICGIPAETLREVARMYARSRASLIFWGMGISQHVHGTDNARCLIALALVTGQIGRPGTGLHPLRGQNNVQGASDAGLIPMFLPDYQPVGRTDLRAPFETDRRGTRGCCR